MVDTDFNEFDELPSDGILMSWEVPEFVSHNRGRRWYVLVGLVLLALIVQAILTSNFIFAIILVMGAILIFMTSARDPGMVPFAITTGGILVGDHYHPYHEFHHFSVLYQPPQLKHIYFTSSKNIGPVLKISLEDVNPNDVRENLLLFLAEDLERTEESLTEMFARVYKL